MVKKKKARAEARGEHAHAENARGKHGHAESAWGEGGHKQRAEAQAGGGSESKPFHLRKVLSAKSYSAITPRNTCA